MAVQLIAFRTGQEFMGDIRKAHAVHIIRCLLPFLVYDHYIRYRKAVPLKIHRMVQVKADIQIF